MLENAENTPTPARLPSSPIAMSELRTLRLLKAVCEVCAVSYEDVVAVATRLPGGPRVVSLDPLTLDDVLGDVERLAAVAGAENAGRSFLGQARQRLERTARAVQSCERPGVLAL